MDKKEEYKKQKKEYNSKLSTFQISKEIHKKVKDFCKERNLLVKDFLEKIILNSI